jgi:hypothetical protein
MSIVLFKKKAEIGKAESGNFGGSEQSAAKTL